MAAISTALRYMPGWKAFQKVVIRGLLIIEMRRSCPKVTAVFRFQFSVSI